MTERVGRLPGAPLRATTTSFGTMEGQTTMTRPAAQHSDLSLQAPEATSSAVPTASNALVVRSGGFQWINQQTPLRAQLF